MAAAPAAATCCMRAGGVPTAVKSLPCESKSRSPQASLQRSAFPGAPRPPIHLASRRNISRSLRSPLTQPIGLGRGVDLTEQRQQGLRRHRGHLITCASATGTASAGDWPQPQDTPAAEDLGLPSGYPVPTAREDAATRVRAVAFYLWTFLLAVPLFLSMCIIWPFTQLFDKPRRIALHWVNDIWAYLSTSPFYKVEMTGEWNLPDPSTGAVYVANHQSYLDIYTLFRLQRPFKFISKTSNFLIPIIGWSMFLTGHIPLKRTDKRSQMECLRACEVALSKGASVLFFPEGTRSKDGKLGAFKKGAFSVARKAKVPVIPITLVGAGKLMPNGKENTLKPGTVRIYVHPALSPDATPDELLAQSREVIASCLPPSEVALP